VTGLSLTVSESSGWADVVLALIAELAVAASEKMFRLDAHTLAD
jgi:hypothetical protein